MQIKGHTQPIQRLLSALLLLLLAGCTTSIVIEGTVPTPLVARIPARIGVYYSPEFKAFRHEESIAQQGTYKVDMGAQNLSFFRNLMKAMFTSVAEVGEPPLTADQMNGLDGVLVPEIVKYGFLTPAISGLNFYSASIHYRISLFDRAGTKLGDWSLVGYGKAESITFGEKDALAEATLLAIRDGGARIAIELPSEPFVAQWLGQNAVPGAASP